MFIQFTLAVSVKLQIVSRKMNAFQIGVCVALFGIHVHVVNGQDGARFTKLADDTKAIVLEIKGTYPESMSGQCQLDLLYWADQIHNETDWALLMADAYGFPESGYFEGNTVWEGTYLQCREGDRQAKLYGGREAHHCIAFWGSVYFIRNGLGLCVPKTCSEEDVLQYMRIGSRIERITIPFAFPTLGLRPVTLYCVVPMSEKNIGSDPSAIVAIVILSVFGVIVCIASMVDIILTQRKKTQVAMSNISNGSCVTSGGENNSHNNLPEPIANASNMEFDGSQKNKIILSLLLAFSICRHVPKMVSFIHPKGSLKCINGIRSVAFLWIVLGHAFSLGVWITQVPTVANKSYMWENYDHLSYYVIASMDLSVETFFVLSACLTTLSLLKQLDNENKPTGPMMGKFYFHRFWRLTPVYMLVLMFYACLFHYIGDGPFYSPKIGDVDGCRDVWWKHLLYVNNIFNDETADCMGWTWYLANDFQFYLISPVFIIVFFYFVKAGIIFAILAVLGSLTSLIYLNYILYPEDTYYYIYTKPWTRSSTYFIGILLGYLLRKMKCRKTIMNKAVVAVLWITALTTLYWCIYGGAYANDNKASFVAYESLKRPSFGIAVAWIIFACITGNAGFVNSIMSWHGWIPIAKLSYVGYLVHPIMIFYTNYRRPVQQYLTHWDQMYTTLGHIMLTLAVSFIVSLCLEVPFGSIEKIFFNSFKKDKGISKPDKTATDVPEVTNTHI